MFFSVRDSSAAQRLLGAADGHGAGHAPQSHGHRGADVCDSLRYARYAGAASHFYQAAHPGRGARQGGGGE